MRTQFLPSLPSEIWLSLKEAPAAPAATWFGLPWWHLLTGFGWFSPFSLGTGQ